MNHPSTSPNNTNPIQNLAQYGQTDPAIDLTKTSIEFQNVQGLFRLPRDANGDIIPNQERDLCKLEEIIDNMRQNNIGAKLIAETWLEGDATDEEIGGYHVFRHNYPESDGDKRIPLYKGVAIILSPEFYAAWKAARNPPPITTYINGPIWRPIHMS